MTNQSDLVQDNLELAEPLPFETLDEFYDFATDSMNQLLAAYRVRFGEEKVAEYVDATINARPGPVWSSSNVLFRGISRALRGEQPADDTFEDRMRDSRIALSLRDTFTAIELHENPDFSEKPFDDIWTPIADRIEDLRYAFDDDEMSFDVYHLALLDSCQYLAALISARAVSVAEATSILKRIELDQKTFAHADIPKSNDMAYDLLHTRVLEKYTADDDDGAEREAAYLIDALEDDALRAAKLMTGDFLVRQRLGNYVRSYIDDSAFRDGKIDAWKTLVRVAPDLISIDDPLATAEGNQSMEIESVDLDTFKPLEVDWEVLPAGQLQDAAREIAEESKDAGHEVVIDPERLKALETIRTQWGADKSYYAKGALKTRKVQRDSTKQCPDQYILLVMQDTDEDGNMIEHVVAESPIAGPHAMYVYRQDVNPEVNWRTVMSVEKQDARKLGARPLKHPTLDDPTELPDIMADRVAILLSATPDEFLRLEFRKNGFTLRSKLAIKAFAAIERETAQAT